MTVLRDLDRTVARLLTGGAYLSVGLLASGVVLMVVNGISPLADAPSMDLGRIPADIVALTPTGFLWLGLLVTLATPLARVAASLVGYVTGGERRMATVSIAILVVVSVGVVLGVVSER
jgi:uncharacterized membrane protein